MTADADIVADALLRYTQTSTLYRRELATSDDVTERLDVLVRLALGRSVRFSSSRLHAPGMSDKLKGAAVSFIRHVLFREDASHYQLLALRPGASLTEIRENYRLLIHVVHPDRLGTTVEWPTDVAVRLNRAYSILKNDLTREAYHQAAGVSPSSSIGKGFRPLRMTVAHSHSRYRGPYSTGWISNRVGDFFRNQPSLVLFGGIVSLCALVIVCVLWSEREVRLARGSATPHVQKAAVQSPIAPALDSQLSPSSVEDVGEKEKKRPATRKSFTPHTRQSFVTFADT